MPRQDPERLVTDVGRRIAELRRRAGLTQADFGRALRSTPQYVQRLEAGQNLTLHSLAKIANALGIAVSEIFVPTEYRRPSKAGRPPTKNRRPPP
ncbi:MAG: helix-turn-helix domain-containing protein [Polyangiaceae bacterium]